MWRKQTPKSMVFVECDKGKAMIDRDLCVVCVEAMVESSTTIQIFVSVIGPFAVYFVTSTFVEWYLHLSLGIQQSGVFLSLRNVKNSL